MRSMVQQAIENQHLKFSYVLTDSWFASSNNMLFMNKLKKYFVMDIKSNRLCMFSTEDRNKGQWVSLDKLPLQPEQPVKVWIKDLQIEVILCKFVHNLNHFALKAKLYVAALKMTWKQLELLKNC